jgi:hypothetical protein
MGKSSSPAAMDGETLSDVVSISRQFLRSVRIDADLGREDALAGYVCQSTSKSLLEGMARQVRDTKQRAFTWTGPYGGGKSSLALLLCSLVGANAKLRTKAQEILNLSESSAVHAAFTARGSGWLVVPVVGKRGKVTTEISRSLATATHLGAKKKANREKSDVIGDLVAAADQHTQGVLLVIDELGKFLESASFGGDDIGFFQDLAEAASRASGKLVIVGILHQSFDAYAARLGRQARDDWAKVQGRYVDIPLVAGTDEVLDLVGRAIEVQPAVDRAGSEIFATRIAKAIRERRPGTPENIGTAIARCWPLHPVVATLLGPISRRRFSQNERSTFGFLASREPLGFSEFLSGSPVHALSMYGPSRYWDYLKANFEPAILASPDGHRWAVTAEAVERSESKGTQLHVELTKCVSLIEMFRSGSGLVPETEVLKVSVQGASETDVAESLRDLVSWKILIERKHLNAYGVFAGSDFDIDAAINQAMGEIGVPDLHHLTALTDLQPILAKRLYHETGTMRWFARRMVRLDDIGAFLSAYQSEKGSVGTFALCLPELGTTIADAKQRVQALSRSCDKARVLVIGVPENAERISELAQELVACERVFSTRSDLDGDSVARKEMVGRISAVRAALEEELSDAFGLSAWFHEGRLQNHASSGTISWIASNIAEGVYPRTPIISNELINREDPSSNSNKARKDLLYRMVASGAIADLGYEGYPADAGLYFSVVKPTGLHRNAKGETWTFCDPYGSGSNAALAHMWDATKAYLLEEGSNKTLNDVYALWRSPPYGLRTGVMPVLAMAFFLAHRATLALYVDGAFTSDLSEATIDEWLLDPKRIALRFVSASTDQSAYLRAVASSIPWGVAGHIGDEPLDVARALVGLVVALPNWTRRTATLSPLAQSVRGMLLKANDPHKVLFSDLPTLLNAKDAKEVLDKLRSVNEELVAAYPTVIQNVQSTVLIALDLKDMDFERLKARARVVKGIAGEFRLEAFVARLEGYDGSVAATEGLLSLATNKPPAQWVDRDIDSALLQLGAWAHEFRRAETLAPLRGRPSTRRAIGIVFGGGQGVEGSASIDIDDQDSPKVSRIASRLVVELQKQSREIALAALAEAGARLLSQIDKETQQ